MVYETLTSIISQLSHHESFLNMAQLLQKVLIFVSLVD